MMNKNIIILLNIETVMNKNMYIYELNLKNRFFYSFFFLEFLSLSSELKELRLPVYILFAQLVYLFGPLTLFEALFCDDEIESQLSCKLLRVQDLGLF